MKNLQVRIAEEISGSSQVIQDKVVESLAGVEIARRTKLVTKALQKYEENEKAVKKIRPDQQSFDSDGKLVSETFSKAKLDERAKAQKLSADLVSAVEKALENNDYGPLEKLTG